MRRIMGMIFMRASGKKTIGLRSVIAFAVGVVVILMIWIIRSTPPYMDRYTGVSVSSSGNRMASFESNYYEPVRLFSECGTNVYIKSREQGKVNVLRLNFATGLLLTWVDEATLDITIPWSKEAYVSTDNSGTENLGPFVAGYKSMANGVSITINGKKFSDKPSQNKDCVALDYERWKLR